MYKKPETLKIVLKKPNEEPEVIDIKNTLEAISFTLLPLILIIEIPPFPIAVDMATIFFSFSIPKLYHKKIRC